MVNNINNNTAPAVVSQPPASAPRADIQLPQPLASAPLPALAPAENFDQVSADLESSRIQRVEAALESIRNSFAVSDSRFTIFRDITGDFVTRITSLRDGSVTTIPEKTLFELAAARDARFAEISASLNTSA